MWTFRLSPGLCVSINAASEVDAILSLVEMGIPFEEIWFAELEYEPRNKGDFESQQASGEPVQSTCGLADNERCNPIHASRNPVNDWEVT